MRNFEITVPTGGDSRLAITISIEAENWFAALRESLEELSEAQLFDDAGSLPGHRDYIEVTDVEHQRSYVVQPKDPNLVPDYRADVSSFLDGLLIQVRRTAAQPDGEPHTDPQEDATRLNQISIQDAVTEPLMAALDPVFHLDAKETLPELSRLAVPRPIIRARGLKRLEPSPRSRPMAPPHKAPQELPQVFRPVQSLDDQCTGEIAQDALATLWNHIPCSAAQILKARKRVASYDVAAARGKLGLDLAGATVRLDEQLESELVGETEPCLFADLGATLTYTSDDKRQFRFEIDAIIWVPLCKGDRVAAVVALMNARGEQGFSHGQFSGARYLARTIGRDLESRY